MSPDQPRCRALPLALPADAGQRAVLVMFRRMAAHGLYDAHAAAIALDRFGLSFRQPLVLLRCFVHELASAANRRIAVAPCCAPGMTRDEALVVDALFERSPLALEAVCDSDDVARCRSTAVALRAALDPVGSAAR